MSRTIKIVFSVFILLVALRVAYVYFAQEDDHISLIGDEGRLYLEYGTIYTFGDDPDKEYDIVNITLHVTSEQYKKMIFFDSPEEAEAAGYKPSESFAEDYECLKQGKRWFDCLQPPDYYDD